MPNGNAARFVLLADYVPDAIIELRYFTGDNFVGRPIEGYLENTAILTEPAALALRAAAADFAAMGLRVKIVDAYRPCRAVADFVRWAADPADDARKADFYPMLEKRDLFPQGYISERSPHSRGSAVDLTLCDARTGAELDMGGQFDFFGEESHSEHRAGLTDGQYANRMCLRRGMEAHGFRYQPEEWWHFNLNGEPYPDTYFDFPVEAAAVRAGFPQNGN